MMRRYGGPVQTSVFPATTVSQSGELITRWTEVQSSVSSVDGHTFDVGIPQTVSPAPFTRIEVVNSTFPSYDEIHIDDAVFIEGLHFQGVNGNDSATALALAVAINACPKFTASIDLLLTPTVVTVALAVNAFGRYPVKIVNKTLTPNFDPNVSGTYDGYFEEQSLLDPPERS